MVCRLKLEIEAIRKLGLYVLRWRLEMEKVIDILYKMSSELFRYLNGAGSLPNGLYYVRGRIFDNEEEASSFFNGCRSLDGASAYDKNERYEIDCRNDSVDMNMKKLIREKIYWYIAEFYDESDKSDEFLLLLGFSINLYYIVGMYCTFGKFDIDRISCIIELEDVKKYAELINEYLYSRITHEMVAGIKWLEVENVDSFNETVNLILEDTENVELERRLYNAVKPVHRKYVPEIYMLVRENDSKKSADEYLNDMIKNYPEFKFGWVYRCLEKGVHFYESKGDDIAVYKIKEKIGSGLFLHVLGLKPIDEGGAKIVNGKIKITRPILLSIFGIGIPSIKTVYIDKNAILSNAKAGSPNVELDKKEDITFRDIRKQTECILGINMVVATDGNPLMYTGKLFEVVEKQQKELRDKYNELEKIDNQRRKMIDHLAHSWGNECYPEIVKKVAEELLQSGNSSLANKLFKAYNSENNLMGEIIYLQAAMADESEKLKTTFCDSFYISNDGGEKEWKVSSVIEDALEILVFSLLNYEGNNEKRNICRNKLCVKHTLQELADDYSKRFESKMSSESFVDWFSRKIFPITVDIDECWNKINFASDSGQGYGKIVIKNIFTELFTNVLFHGDMSCKIILESDDNKMYIVVRNNVSDMVKGKQKGLSSMKEMVAKLNYKTSVSEDEGVMYKMTANSIFETRITFAKELMYKEEW